MNSPAVDRARALLAEGHHDEAEQTLRAAAADHDVAAARELGSLLSLSGTYWQDLVHDGEGEAERWLLRAAKADPGDTVAAVLLAGHYAKMHDLALEVDGPEFDPAFDEDLDGPAHPLADPARLTELARTWYASALRVDPACGAAATGLVAVLGDDRAMELFQVAAVGPEGMRAAGAAMEAELVGAAERALSITPDDPVALAALGEVAWRRRDDATAARWFRRLLAVDPDDKDVAERLANLAPAAIEPAEPTKFDLDFLLLAAETAVSNRGDVLREIVVGSDPALLGWTLFSRYGAVGHEPLESGEVRTYRRGRCSATVRAEPGQDPREWDVARLVDLGQPALPLGHPVRVDGRTYHYGYTVIPPFPDAL